MPQVLVIGRSGQLARELARLAWPGGITVLCCGRGIVDLAEAEEVQGLVGAVAPAVVVNAAGYTAVDRAETEPAAAFAVNRDGPAHLAAACAAARLPLIQVSTDYVFDGEAADAYAESAAPAPLSVYGRSKLAGEEAVRRRLEAHLILRTGGIYSPFGDNLVRRVLERARSGQALAGLADRRICPTAARDLARAIAAIIARLLAGGAGPWGTCHYSGQPPATVLEFIDEILRLGAEMGLVPRRSATAAHAGEWREPARRPRNAALDCTMIGRVWGVAPRPWRDELAVCIREIAAVERGEPVWAA